MRRYLALPLLALAALTARAEVTDIDNAELDRLMKAGATVIDIRTAPEWEETGIVTGSHLLTFFDERGRYDAATWLEQVKRVAKPGDPVVVICRTGNRTKPVSQFLDKQAGYTKVYNVRNGIKAWIGSGAPVAPARETLAACRAAKTC